jgi:hypothetical protein
MLSSCKTERRKTARTWKRIVPNMSNMSGIEELRTLHSEFHLVTCNILKGNHRKNQYDRTERRAMYEPTEGTNSLASDFKLRFALV